MQTQYFTVELQHLELDRLVYLKLLAIIRLP